MHPVAKHVIGFPVTCQSFDEQIEIILNWAGDRLSKFVCVANVHMLMEAHHSDLGPVLHNADLVTPDGMPLVWMLRLMGSKKQERVAGLDILDAVCKKVQERDISVLFLGSQSEILESMRVRLKQEFPDLKIAGMEPLPFRPLTPDEDRKIIQKINQSGAGIVFVSLGCPKQEHWMNLHKEKIQAVMIGLGGAFPVYAGIQKRAPGWMREMGLEWLYRLLQEPRRLWKRYSSTIPLFIWLALKQVIADGLLRVKDTSSSSNLAQ